MMVMVMLTCTWWFDAFDALPRALCMRARLCLREGGGGMFIFFYQCCV
jgi:hypothetical protein